MWDLKRDENGALLVVREKTLQAFASMDRHGYHATILCDGRKVCCVKLWSHGSCALSEFYDWNLHNMKDSAGFIEWLKTQPFKSIDSWDHVIFTLLPGSNKNNYEEMKKFLSTYCTVISSFPNHAHGGHTLKLFQLDLSKCT